MNNRRKLLIALGAGAIAASCNLYAQQAAKIPRIGFVGESPQSDSRVKWFQRGLRDLGYVEGRNIVVEYRWTEGRDDRRSGILSDLIRLNVDVMVFTSITTALAAKSATTSIPIIYVGATDPVAVGFVANLARPGGNVTALASFGGDTVAKRLELAREIIPRASRLAVLNSPGSNSLAQIEAAAKQLGIQLQVLDVREPDSIEPAILSVGKGNTSALIVLDSPFIYIHRARITELAAKNRVPLIAGFEEIADLGGMVTYDVDRADLNRRAAGYVDRILKGAKAGDLPVDRPTKFMLVVNLKTAKALGIKIPQSILVRADRVIE